MVTSFAQDDYDKFFFFNKIKPLGCQRLMIVTEYEKLRREDSK